MKYLALGALLTLGILFIGEQTTLADAYSYTSIIDPSAAGVTGASGINHGGAVVGFFQNGSGSFGFVESGGVFTTINSSSGVNGTFAYGINDSGSIVGSYFDTGFVPHGFLDIVGTLVTVVDNGDAFGINNSSQIVGDFTDGSGTHGYVDTSSVFSTINYPGASLTAAEGINNGGKIVGYFNDGGGTSHGFLDTGGVFTELDDPSGTLGTMLYGINDSGEIVGDFVDGGGTAHGFVYSSGVFTTLSDPAGTIDTVAFGIDNSGDVVGSFDFSTASGGVATEGFVATPTPEPSTLALLSVGLIGLAASSRRKKRFARAT